MYRLMRNIHLILGLVFFFVLGVYMLSSVRLAHRSWFANSPTITEEDYSVDPAQAGTPRQLGMYLIREHGFVGELFRVQPPKDGKVNFIIRRLGTNYRVEYELGATTAHVRTAQTSFTGMLSAMHFASGLWHDNQLINVWVVVLFLTSVALFLMGATGIYLWFKTYDERVVGSILLGVGLAFSLTIMVMIRTQG